MILDRSQTHQKHSYARFLLSSGVDTRIDPNHAIAHDKVMIINGEVVITGSYNFTRAAEERNAENLLVVREVGIAKRYADNRKVHQGRSELLR